MEYKVKTTKTFEKEIKRLGKHYASITDDYAQLLNDLYANPQLGTDLGGGLRKVRMRITSKGKGKSGSARVITSEINLLYIYDKSERESITHNEIDELLRKNGLK